MSQSENVVDGTNRFFILPSFDPSAFCLAPPKELNKVRLTILVGMMFSLLVAGIFRTPPIVFMAAFLGVAPPLAILIGRLSSRRLTVTRDFPVSGQVGDVLYGRVRVHNNAAWPAFLTEVRAGQVTQPFYDLPNEKSARCQRRSGRLA